MPRRPCNRPREHFTVCPCNPEKLRYRDEHTAKRAAEVMTLFYQSPRFAYACRSCGAWHVTSKPPRDEKLAG